MLQEAVIGGDLEAREKDSIVFYSVKQAGIVTRAELVK
jgi:hypothetical protein